MKRYVSLILILFVSAITFADDTGIQDKIKSEYGNCYGRFRDDLAYCNLATCNYPDLSDSKAWKAQVVRGFVDNKCYVVYYSYVGDQILGTPEHCFYTPEQVKELANLYSNLFYNNSLEVVTDAREKITRFNAPICKKMDIKKDENSQ